MLLKALIKEALHNQNVDIHFYIEQININDWASLNNGDSVWGDSVLNATPYQHGTYVVLMDPTVAWFSPLDLPN